MKRDGLKSEVLVILAQMTGWMTPDEIKETDVLESDLGIGRFETQDLVRRIEFKLKIHIPFNALSDVADWSVGCLIDYLLTFFK